MKSSGCYWYTKRGTLTSDNRDYCGIAEDDWGNLCILVDGETSSPNGGELARALVCHLLESISRLGQPLTKDSMIGFLRLAHSDLRRQYPADSLSYIIAFGGSGSLITMHAGDCRLGRWNRDGSIRWLTRVHSLATAIHDIDDHELRSDPNRHLLTRSFRSRRFQMPEYNIHKLERRERLLLASDGFWADLGKNEQLKVLGGGPIERQPPSDDVSCLILPYFGKEGRQAPLATECEVAGTSAENLIVLRRHRGAAETSPLDEA